MVYMVESDFWLKLLKKAKDIISIKKNYKKW